MGCAKPLYPKMNGLSLEASRDSLHVEQVKSLMSVHANYVAIMPFGFIRNADDPEVHFNSDRQWFGETVEGSKQYIRTLHSQGLEVMMKPQIWIGHGVFTGHFSVESEEAWKVLENSYANFILTYARVAEEEKADLLCIGTEMEAFHKNRPEFWNGLIKEVREVYKGKITYAANWDEYKDVPFWTDLDFVGIDAYFPVALSETPSLDEAKAGWAKWKDEMEELSLAVDKQILFTEYGYRSLDYAGKEPWETQRHDEQMNAQAQSNLLMALYEELWDESWFSGGFLWKWHIRQGRMDPNDNNRFTPQNKPAEEVVRSYYRRTMH